TANTVIKYSLADNKSHVVYTNTDPTRELQSLSLGENDHLYISLSPTDYYAKESFFQIDEVDLSSEKTIRSLYPLSHVLYGGISYLFTAGDFDIVTSFGGDGCGGGGTISKYRDGHEESVTEIGAGCAETPRYIGFLSSK